MDTTCPRGIKRTFVAVSSYWGNKLISSFRVQNLRAIADSGHIPLRRVNILVGKNSSGKSSILRLFPLLRQSVESAPKDHYFGMGAWLILVTSRMRCATAMRKRDYADIRLDSEDTQGEAPECCARKS